MCGVVGIIGSGNIGKEIFQALLSLQHRGQDGAGILSYDSSQKEFFLHKGEGLVEKVFSKNQFEQLKGDMGIGHTRYSTVGTGKQNEIQPLLMGHPWGLGMVHNGNIFNYKEVAKKLWEEDQFHFLTNNDLEAVLGLFLQGFNKIQQEMGPLGSFSRLFKSSYFSQFFNKIFDSFKRGLFNCFFSC